MFSIIIKNSEIIKNSKEVSDLLKQRLNLLLNSDFIKILNSIVFDSIEQTYYVDNKDSNKIKIFFSNKVLKDLVMPGEGITFFDKILLKTERELIG